MIHNKEWLISLPCVLVGLSPLQWVKKRGVVLVQRGKGLSPPQCDAHQSKKEDIITFSRVQEAKREAHEAIAPNPQS